MALAILLGAAAPVGAQGPAVPADAPLGPDAPAAAVQRYQLGRTLYQQGRFVEAANEFRAALAMQPGSERLAYNLARSEERAGQTAEAVRHYRRYLELAPRAPDRHEVERVTASLEEQLRAAWPEVALASTPVGAAVTIDGAAAALGRTPLQTHLAPGTHEIRFELPKYLPQTRIVAVVAGTPQVVEVALVSALPAPAAPPAAKLAASAPPSTPASPPPRWRTYAGWGGLGLGAASVVLGAVFQAKSADTRDEARGLSYDDRDRYGALSDRYDGQRAGMYVGYGLGAALVGAGAGLLLWPSPTSDAAEGVR